MTSVQLNQTLSADCVIFGFDGEALKALLVEKAEYRPTAEPDKMKLPGAMIRQNETVPQAAARILEEYTGLRDVPLKQIGIFSDPDRVTPEELEWINKYHGISSVRIVTVGFYALVRMDAKMVATTTSKGAYWRNLDSITGLVMDHMQILSSAFELLYRDMLNSPIVFELLPKKFTIKALQNLFRAVLGVEIDNRNFRKKILSSGMVVATGEKEQNVSHKPAQYYMFSAKNWQKWRKNEKLNFTFISNWKY